MSKTDLSKNPPTRRYEYLTNGNDIYLKSFAMIRNEVQLNHLNEDAEKVAVRIVHAAGDPAIAKDIACSPDFVSAAREALANGAPIFTDANMIAAGITRTRLPQDNEVICTLRNPEVPDLAKAWQTTRAAAATALWLPKLAGALVAIGNAPTALFHLLEMIADGAPKPAAIIGVPVGFVGSPESKIALAENPYGVPWLVVHGRRGGSAMAASAINALAKESEL